MPRCDGKLQPQKPIGQTISREGIPGALAAMDAFPGAGITVIATF